MNFIRHQSDIKSRKSKKGSRETDMYKTNTHSMQALHLHVWFHTHVVSHSFTRLCCRFLCCLQLHWCAFDTSNTYLLTHLPAVRVQAVTFSQSVCLVPFRLQLWQAVLSCRREAATICPRKACKVVTLYIIHASESVTNSMSMLACQYSQPKRPRDLDLLTLKVVSETRVTWDTSVPILVFLGLSVLDLGPIYATETSDRCQTASSLNPPAYGGGGIIISAMAIRVRVTCRIIAWHILWV